jgi:uncharacterized protein YegL
VPVQSVHAAHSYPDNAQLYLQSGESIQALHPVTVDGRQYTIVYYQTQPNSDTEGEILYDKRVGRWQNAGIAGVLVFDGKCPVYDESILRKSLLTETSGYMLTQVADIPEMITVSTDMENQLRLLSSDPRFAIPFLTQNIDRLFKTTEEEYLEVFRAMLVPQGTDVQTIKAFSSDVQKAIEAGKSVQEAIDSTASLGTYSSIRVIRNLAKGTQGIFKDWNIDPLSQTGEISVPGTSKIVDVEYFNSLKLVSLAILLLGMQDLSMERAEMLERLSQASRNGEIDLEPKLLSAIDMVVSEAKDANTHRADIVVQFVRDQAVDLAVNTAEDVLVKKLATWAFNTYGRRTMGHLVAGLAAQVVAAFAISNFLYGMDDVYINGMSAVRASELEKIFNDLAISVKNKYQGQAYDYHYADLYRTGVFFKNLSAAQSYRSYAEQIESSRVIKWAADLFTGGEWDRAQKFFIQYSNDSEQEIEDLIGHPQIVDYAIDLVAQRRAMRQQTVQSTSSTELIFDVSGSMNEEDSTGTTKLDAAKSAGGRILDIIDSENYASCISSSEVGIISFSSSATVNDNLLVDTNSARSALNGLYANGGTGMADGLRLAIDQLQTIQSGKPVIILLSDGMPNIGLNGDEAIDESQVRQQVLDLATEAGGKKICIYTVGFGVPNSVGSVSGAASIDEDFLKQVSANAGCGSYYNAQNATELANVYVNLRHESTGSVLLQKTGSISQGQTVNLGVATVASGTSELLFTLNWPGSRLDPSLIDPNGKVVDQNYPGASFFQTKTLASVIIQNPAPGNWKFTGLGVEVPEGIIEYNAVVSVRASGGVIPAATANFPAVLVVVPLILGVLMTYVFVVSAKRGRKHFKTGHVAPKLYISSGQGAGRVVSLRDNMIIGRSRTCSIYIPDPSVSRQHARLRYSNGQWFIQDMGSSSGVYLNGAKVKASALRSGDQVRVGSTVFEFQQ